MLADASSPVRCASLTALLCPLQTQERKFWGAVEPQRDTRRANAPTHIRGAHLGVRIPAGHKPRASSLRHVRREKGEANLSPVRMPREAERKGHGGPACPIKDLGRMGQVNPDRRSRQPPQGSAQIIVLGDRILGPDDGEGSVQRDVFVHQQPQRPPGDRAVVSRSQAPWTRLHGSRGSPGHGGQGP